MLQIYFADLIQNDKAGQCAVLLISPDTACVRIQGIQIPFLISEAQLHLPVCEGQCTASRSVSSGQLAFWTVALQALKVISNPRMELS